LHKEVEVTDESVSILDPEMIKDALDWWAIWLRPG